MQLITSTVKANCIFRCNTRFLGATYNFTELNQRSKPIVIANCNSLDYYDKTVFVVGR